MKDHTFSMGFKSGEYGGHKRTSTPFDSSQSLTACDRWMGALSCMYVNEHSDVAIPTEAESITCIYSTAFMEFEHLSKTPTPSKVIQPQNISVLP
jgi:hypothetical protein